MSYLSDPDLSDPDRLERLAHYLRSGEGTDSVEVSAALADAAERIRSQTEDREIRNAAIRKLEHPWRNLWEHLRHDTPRTIRWWLFGRRA